MVFDRRVLEATKEESEEELHRTKLRVSSVSGLCISSGNVGRVRRMDVTERRRLCTTSCIFGNSVLRTVLTNFCLGVVGVLSGLTGLRLFLENEEVVVMRLEGRISWNVDPCLPRIGLPDGPGGIDELESNGGAQLGDLLS